VAERKIARAFWSDPALGVARYADAGYPTAIARARAVNLKIPAEGEARR
jgi:urocanate hydratase